jgi:hypothetical protein
MDQVDSQECLDLLLALTMLEDGGVRPDAATSGGMPHRRLSAGVRHHTR